MRLHEEFSVEQPAAALWAFFEQPERVSRCMPGVEEVRVSDADNVEVRATQSIGPMSATFDAKVTVLERVPNELIRFQAIGRSVRGAAGNMRSTNAVRLVPGDGSTTVVVDGEVVLAGALGSVGQKIVARQASKIAAEFARNLERSLSGAEMEAPQGARSLRSSLAPVPGTSRPLLSEQDARMVRIAATLSAASSALSILALLRTLRRRPS